MLRTLSSRVSWKVAGASFIVAGAGYYHLQNQREIQTLRRRVDLNKQHQLGGDFTLTDQDGKIRSRRDFLGKYNLIYFGFTHCPDICPEELDHMSNIIRETNKTSQILIPIFITCDPLRDDPSTIKKYLKEFHEQLIGLTGSQEEIKKVGKLFRVYMSNPPKNATRDADYIVDHSVFFFLMDPEGNFVDAFSRNNTPEETAEWIRQHVKDWKRIGKKLES